MKEIAKISGIAYLMIFISGFYANFAVLESLLDINNPSITTANFINNHSQFGNGLLGFVMMLFFDALLVWSLFGLTKSISKNITYLASFFRLLHALFFGIALFKLWNIYQLTFNASNSVTLQHRVMKLLLDFDTLWTVGLLFFGIHLIVLGYLALKSQYIPKALGLLLLLAAIGYIIDGMAKLFMPNYIDYKDVFEVIVIMPSVIGEFSFTVWLLIKGFKKQRGLQNAKFV
ncbi:DUF4386 domain-containing protein [Flavobacteriaceae bacterium S0825]|uniref:DUF4386 domain-containing protein n=1 Tax=Gaetbulibacter sp. S0825 TaxID=2720084 RepID=UPI0014320DC8|nr:DUF4386 domain-containing protein [Gaetbulibacter sp. S0825]MCK0107916.1 DUF4386 domain-containing protein [Flavobacteriaceae bacterium S0825]NIX63552.1 DUF4386 domain-containing protein [Gaetbulibacter sp. S0825]